MRITGKYENFDAKTFKVELSAKDLVHLRIMLREYDIFVDCKHPRFAAWMQMLDESDDKDFGFEITETKEY